MKKSLVNTFLEINDVSFKYYVGIYLVLLVLDIVREDFVFRYLRFPLSWLMWFVIFTGLIKFSFNLERIINWLERTFFKQSGKILKILYLFKKPKDSFPKFIGHILKFINSVFSYSLILYLSLLLIEEFEKTKFVQKYLFFEYSPVEWFLSGRMNLLLGFVIVVGILSVLAEERGEGEEERGQTSSGGLTSNIRIRDYVFIFGLGIIGAILIFYKTKELGWLSYVISGISGLLIILLSVIILDEDD